ncbi:MAG: hypothetical protein AAF216_11750 [Pseudomonadota bacterium]
MENPKPTKHPDDKVASISLDSMAEDLLGLNIRGLRSVAALWTRPRDYFAAARTPDWNDRFTPSIRLWLSFFALFSALRFWWLGGSQGMIGAYADGFTQAGLMVPEGMTIEEIGIEAVFLVFGVVPILQVITMVLLALAWGVWGEKTSITQRQRYLFGVIVPSASLMPIFLTVMMFMPQSLVTAFGIGLAVVSFFTDFQTGYRGLFTEVSRFGRIWRATLLSAVIVTLNVLTSLAAQIGGIIYIASKYGVAPAG